MGRGEEAQDKVLTFIEVFHMIHGYGPSRREISEATEVPLGVVQNIVRKLASNDQIHYEEGVARSIRVKK